MASEVVGGVLNLRIGGTVYSTDGEITIEDFGGEVLEPVPQVSGEIHYKRMIQPASFTVKLTTTAGVDIRALKDARNVSVALQAVNGVTYLLRDGVQTGGAAVNVAEGTAELKFTGQRIEVL